MPVKRKLNLSITFLRSDGFIHLSGVLQAFLIECGQNQCLVVAESAVIGYSHDIKGEGRPEVFTSAIEWGKKRVICLQLTSMVAWVPLSVVLGVYAFVVLKQGVDAQKGDVSQQLKDIVSKRIAKYASPDCIQVILSHLGHNPNEDNRALRLRVYSLFCSCSLWSVCQRHAQVK